LFATINLLGLLLSQLLIGPVVLQLEIEKKEELGFAAKKNPDFQLAKSLM
jgi:hypothetical protein